MSHLAPAAQLADLFHGLCSFLAPRRCLTCGHGLPPRPGRSDPDRPWAAWLCVRCRRGVQPIGPGACRACGRDQGPHAEPVARCGACRDTPLAAVASTTALFRYRGAARHLLRQLKYGGAQQVGPPLGRALARRLLERRGPAPADLVVVPVPLHPWRAWRRGYNQAERVAEGVAEALDRPLVPALSRRRATRALYGVPRAAREAVVAGAFRARRRPGVAGRPVLLVDDIRTSGATLRAAAQALREAGAARVDAAVVGR